MKKGWEVRKLKDLGTNKSSIVSGPFGSNLKVKDYKDSGVPIIRLQNIGKGYFLKKDIKYISDEKANELKYHSFNVGDIVLAKLGVPIGKTCIIPDDFRDGIIVADVVRIRPNRNKANYNFLEFFLNSDISVKQLTKNISGATRPRVNLDDVRNIDVSLPPLEEQKQIVAILDKAFEKIEKSKEIAQKNLKNAKDLFESYLQEVFENKGDDWDEKTLGEVLIKTETVNPTKKPNDEFIYIDVSSVDKETKEIINTTTLLGKDAPSRARKLIRANDVIFATVRPTHSRVALIAKEYDRQVCSTGYFVLRAMDLLNNDLVFYFLLTDSFNKEMEELQKGASYPAVNDADVKGVYIPFPKSLEKQKQIVTKLNQLREKTKKLETIYQQKLTQLEELKKSILQKAFNGELETIKEIAA